MRAYFSQFGPINRLRLSRNRKTGKSKHYAFLEFESPAVAKIVANTMDKYLLFGHILKCKVAPVEQLHADLWKGANKRFKTVPWNKIEGRKMGMAMRREEWEKRIRMEKKRREGKLEAMRELGYEFEGGELKELDEVPVREGTKEIKMEEAATDEILEEKEEENSPLPSGEKGPEMSTISGETTTTEVKNHETSKGDKMALIGKKSKITKVKRRKESKREVAVLSEETQTLKAKRYKKSKGTSSSSARQVAIEPSS